MVQGESVCDTKLSFSFKLSFTLLNVILIGTFSVEFIFYSFIQINSYLGQKKKTDSKLLVETSKPIKYIKKKTEKENQNIYFHRSLAYLPLNIVLF